VVAYERLKNKGKVQLVIQKKWLWSLTGAVTYKSFELQTIQTGFPNASRN